MTEQATETGYSMSKFWLIFAGQGFSLLGSRLVQFSLVWYLTNLSNSATILATASLIALLPQIIVGPFAGVLVDRLDRRKIMIAADLMIALVIIGLAALFSLGLVEVWHVYLGMFIRSLGSSFHWPAFQSSTSLMVKKENLGRVGGGINKTLEGLVNIAVPPMAAILLEFIPIQSILAIDVVTAVIAIVPLLFISVPSQVKVNEEFTLSNFFSDFREGLSYILNWKGLMYIWGLALFLKIVLIPAFTLLPLYVKEYFGGSAIEYAWFQSANGVGMIVGGLLLGVWGGFSKKIVTAMTGYALGGALLTIFGFVPPSMLMVGVGTVFLFSLVLSMGDASFFAMLQASVPPEMQGRVMMISMSLSALTGPLGLMFAGPLTETFGMKIWYLGAGLILGSMSPSAFLVPAVMNIEEGPSNYVLSR